MIGDPLAPSTSRCAAMRRSFDEAFSLPAAQTMESAQNMLAVRLGGDAYALRLEEIAGLHVDLQIVPLPGPAPHLLGIAAIRGVMSPLYDLAGLLGYPPAATRRWVVTVRAPHLLGLAIESFEAHVRVRDLTVGLEEQQGGSRATRHSRGAIQTAGGLRPILQVPALIQSIRESSHDGRLDVR